MKKRRIGQTGLAVSEIGFGTAALPETSTEKEFFRILDFIEEQGINFIDTAEIYPPADLKYSIDSLSEQILGKWLKQKPREKFIIGTKISGPFDGLFGSPLRSGNTALDKIHIRKAIEGSLKRLQTDYIDLYQIHWPDHHLGYVETLETLSQLHQEGKVRCIGCCNETPWGLMKSIEVARNYQFLQYQSVQNSYSLIDRTFEVNLKELCQKENISLIAYSPLGGGVLTGTYLNQEKLPKNSRYEIFEKLQWKNLLRLKNYYLNERTLAITEKFLDLSKDLDCHPNSLAIIWSKQNHFTASTLIGGNSLKQIQENLRDIDFVIPEELMQKLNEISKKVVFEL